MLLTEFDEALGELEESKEPPVLRDGRPLQRGEGEEEGVLGRVDDEVAHLAAVRPDLGRHLVGAVVDGHVVERAAVKIKVESMNVFPHFITVLFMNYDIRYVIKRLERFSGNTVYLFYRRI